MKKLVFIAVLIFTIKVTFAQNITFSVNGGTVNAQEYLFKPGDQVTVELCNVNPFTHEIQIETEKVTYGFDEMPDIFSGITSDLDKATEDAADEDEVAAEGGIGTTPESRRNIMLMLLADVIDSYKEMANIDGMYSALGDLVNTSQLINIQQVLNDKDRVMRFYGFNCDNPPVCKTLLRQHFRGFNNEFENSVDAWNDKYQLLPSSEKSSLKPLHDKVNKLKAEFTSDDFENKIEKLVELYDGINQDSFCQTYIFTVGSEDGRTVKYAIKPKKDVDLINNYPKGDTLSILVGRRLKFDFSAGMFGTGLADWEFTTRPKIENGDTSQVIDYKNQNSFEFGAGALLHVQYQFNKNWSPALSFGVMANGDGRPRYLAGLGVIIGRKPRVILNGGLAYGAVKRLSGSQTIGETSVENFDEVQIIDKYQSSWFAGITYNF